MQQIDPIVDFAPAATEDSLIDVPWLKAVAELARTGGPAWFTPGGGVILDRPLPREVARALPRPRAVAPRWLELPPDRALRALETDRDFAAWAARFVIPHRRADYRMVVVPLTRRLTADELLGIAEAAETFGHGTLRLTADVSIRLPNVPLALLPPLWRRLRRAGLAEGLAEAA